MRMPPPLLPAEVHSFWNDRGRGEYGEIVVGSRQYDYHGPCRTARITAINETTRLARDETLLYCLSRDGGMRWDPTISCRASDGALSCRSAGGEDVTLLPS